MVLEATAFTILAKVRLLKAVITAESSLVGRSYSNIHRWRRKQDIPIKASLHEGTAARAWGPASGSVLLEHSVSQSGEMRGKMDSLEGHAENLDLD